MEKTKVQSKEQNKEYLLRVFRILTAREGFVISSEKTHFNKTELRLISEVLAARYENKRLFSTQIAKMLGVTRSAISHTVQRLEERGVIIRIPSETDKKVEYIEISESILELYKEDLEKCARFIGEVVAEFGEKDFYKTLVGLKGFCLHHYAELLRYSNYAGFMKDEYVKILSSNQSRNFERLKGELKQFCDKHDYRNANMPLGDAETALPRMREKFYGKKID